MLSSKSYNFSGLICQEPVKTKHPQLHYESKVYMLLQGGSKWIVFICFGYSNPCSHLRISYLFTIFLKYRWYPTPEVVRCRGGVQRYGDRSSWPKLGRLV